MSGPLLHWIHGKTCELTIKSGCIEVRRGYELVERIPLQSCGLLVVSGKHQLDSGVLRELAARSVAVLFADQRARSFCSITPNLSLSLATRHAQHLCFADGAHRLAIARLMLRAKLLQTDIAALNHGDADLLLASLRHAQVEIDSYQTIEQIMGLEGSVAAMYFRHFATWVPAPFKFEIRARRPPPDPVNALLFFGYALALSEASAIVAAYGFDPVLGFLHAPQPARESFTLDVLELLRPGVDQWVLSCLTILTPEHFQFESARGCFLGQPGMRTVLALWANARLNWPTSQGRSLRQVMRLHLLEVRSAFRAFCADQLIENFDDTELDNVDLESEDAGQNA